MKLLMRYIRYAKLKILNYICFVTKMIIMDLQLRKYNFIQELVNVEEESVIEALELVLKREKEQHEEISNAQRKELDQRLQSYKNNPDDILDWEAVKNDW